MSKKSPSKEAFLRILSNHYRGEELFEGIQFLPEEMMEKAGLSRETFRRVVEEIEEKGEGAYIPPFRGRGLRLLSRPAPSELPIDFQKLQRRKAYEFEKLNQMMTYGVSSQCRRVFLLEYFGESHTSRNCGGCDYCTHHEAARTSSETAGDSLLAIKILSGVARLKGRFGLGMAAKMLTGSKEMAMGRYRLDRLSTYGLLSEFGQGQIERWIQELMATGFLRQELTELGERSYKVLLLTSRGWAAMKKMEQISLSPIPSTRRMEPIKAPGLYNSDLFDRLRRLRADLARAQGVPHYCIFQDRTLREMASRFPDTPAKMRAVFGVGETTFKKYGRTFLEAITSYLRQPS